MAAKLITLGLLSLSVAFPVAAQAPNPSQFLQGLLSGNQGQDQAVRDAFERGYRRGRDDQQRADRDQDYPRPPDRRPDVPPPYGRDQGVYPPVPYGR